MKVKNKHVVGAAAALFGIGVFVASMLVWFVGRDFNTWVQAGLAFGLVCLAAAAALEIDVVTRVLQSRQARHGAEAVVVSVAFVAIFGLLNYILNQDRLKQRWDLTETGEHSLAPETLEVLEDLPGEVRALGFYTPTSPSRARAEELLDSYVFHGRGKFSYEFHDPDVKVTLAQDYDADDGTIVLEMDGRRETVDFPNEQSVTGALVRVVHPTDRVLYFVTGHQERDPEQFGDEGLSQMAQQLERVGFTLETTSLFGDALPEDADVLVLAGAQSPYSEQEVELVAAFLEQGGSLVYLAEPTLVMSFTGDEGEPLLDYLAESWGIRVRDDIVVDFTLSAQNSPFWPASFTYGTSPVTQELQGLITVFPGARSIEVSGMLPADVTVTPLVFTSPNAWGETDFATLEDSSMTPDGPDAVGELILGAAAENSATGARVVVFGDADFGSNTVAREVFGNSELFQNATKWATVEDELISLTPGPQVYRSHSITTIRDVAIVTLLACILPPVLVLGIGGLVWWTRRGMV